MTLVVVVVLTRRVQRVLLKRVQSLFLQNRTTNVLLVLLVRGIHEIHVLLGIADFILNRYPLRRVLAAWEIMLVSHLH